MIDRGPIVCGGGWKSRTDFRIKFWSTILFLVTLFAAIGLANWVGVWAFVIPVALFVVSRFSFGQDARRNQPVANVPKDDLNNLH